MARRSVLFGVALLLAIGGALVLLLLPPRIGLSAEDDVICQASILRTALRQASEIRGVPLNEILSSFTEDTNGITSAVRGFCGREKLLIDDSGNLPHSFLRDRGGNDLLVFRKEDVPKGADRPWMSKSSGAVLVWGVGANGTNDWGEGDDIAVDFDRLAPIRNRAAPPIH